MQNGYSKRGQGKKALEFPYELGNPGPDWRRKQETRGFAWEVEARDPPHRAQITEGAFAYDLSEFVYAGAGNVRYKGPKNTSRCYRAESMRAVTVQKSFTITIEEIWKIVMQFWMCQNRPRSNVCVPTWMTSQSQTIVST